MSFEILGLPATPFIELYGLSDADLTARNAKRYIADANPGFPDRIELRDVEVGEPLILVHHEHQPGATPYRASHAIFVREGAVEPSIVANQIPEVLRTRVISARAFDAKHWMIDADLCAGSNLDEVIERLLANEEVEYLQLHFAKYGCYAARVQRAEQGFPSSEPSSAGRPRPSP
jgi:hypothetical protein